MSDKQYVQFVFEKSAPMHEVEQTLRLACLATESLHGPDRMRLQASFLINRSKRNCLIHSASEVGMTLALIFSGFVKREFGEDGVKIKTPSACTLEIRGAPK